MEFVRFCIVGGISTLLDMFVMGCVLYAFNPSLYASFWHVFLGSDNAGTIATIVSTGSGFLSGLIVSYFLSVLFVFINKGNSQSVGGFAMFALISAGGLAIHLLGMYVGYTLIGINEWLVKIFLTIVVLFYNYIMKSKIIFKGDKNVQTKD